MLYDLHQNNELSPVTLSLFLAFWPCVPKVVFDMSYWAFFGLLTICPREKSPQKHWEYMAGTITSVQFYTLFLKFSSWAQYKKKWKTNNTKAKDFQFLFVAPKTFGKIETVNKAFLFWNWQRPKKIFFRNKTFLFFKIESWNFQVQLEIEFR